MPSWGDLLGTGSVAEQLLVWGVLNQLLGDLLGPALELVREKVAAANPVLPLTPDALADAVVKGIVTEAEASPEAAKNAINAERFHQMVLGAGEPPGLEQVLEAWRRGFIDWPDVAPDVPSVERAIKTSRLFTYWAPVIEKMADVPITVGEAVEAYIRGQLDEATAMREAGFSGINPDRFQVLADAAGRPPSLGELLELKRRGLIDDMGLGPAATTFQQGIAEGDTKNKWLAQYLRLAEYIPPPRTVTALLKTGAISQAKAEELWADAGLTAELAAAYAKSSQGEKMAGTRQLAESTVLALFEVQALTEPEAATHLAALGYAPADVALMLEVTDLQRELKVVNSGVTRLGTLYVSHKITRLAASDGLGALGVTAAHRDHLLALWDAEEAANVKTLTPAQIIDAWDYQVISQAEAEAELGHLGYTPFDAWVLLSNKAKAPLPGRPAQGPAGPGVNP